MGSEKQAKRHRDPFTVDGVPWKVAALTTLGSGAVISLLVFVFVFTSGAIRKSSDYFTQTEILQSSDSTFLHMMGEAECRIFGTFGTATVDMETEIQGTGGVIFDVDIPDLVGVLVDTSWVSSRLGAGGYRLEVTGGNGTTDITFHCRRVSK